MDVSSMSKEQIEVAVNALVDRLFGEPFYGAKVRPEGVFRQYAFQLKTELQTAIARTEQLTEAAQQSLGSWGSLATRLGSHAGWLCEQWARQTKAGDEPLPRKNVVRKPPPGMIAVEDELLPLIDRVDSRDRGEAQKRQGGATPESKIRHSR